MRRYAVVAGGLALLCAGLVVLWIRSRQPWASFGWFAYAPLTEPRRYADYLPADGVGPSGWAAVGLVAAGLITTAGGVGYRLGVRAGRAGD